MNLDWLAQRLCPNDGDFCRAGCYCRLHSIQQSDQVQVDAVCIARTAQGGAGVVPDWLAWSLGENLVALLFLFCSLGDILLDLPEDKVPHGF